MHRKIATVALVSLLFSFSFLTPALASAKADQGISPHISDDVIIKFKDPRYFDQKFLSDHALKGAEKILKNTKHNSHAGTLNPDQLILAKLQNSANFEQQLRLLNNDSRVQYAEPNFIVSADLIPNDPSFYQQWGLNNTGQLGGSISDDMKAPQAWDTTHDSNVVVGIIDTGIDYTHPDLAANIWTNLGEIAGNGIDDDGNGYIDDVYGWNFVGNNNNPFDDYGHGTHVAGIIAASGNNNLGVAGVNWSGKVAALKFLSSSGSGTTADAVKAVQYANMMGFKITNNSWGGGGFSQALYDIISAGNNQGSLFVAAAGNNSSNTDVTPSYPAGYDLPNIISVAATDNNDLLAGFSNFGKTSVDLGAPGVNIYSTLPNGTCSLCNSTGYNFLSGTSMASPQVAGAVALMWSYFPSLTNLQAKDKILNTTDPDSSLDGKTVSGGRLNLANLFKNDSTAPAPITDLTVQSTSYNSVLLNWTAVGDDGLTGTASSYDIRYSPNQIDATNFGQAIAATAEPRPKIAGSSETFAVSGLTEGTNYYFAAKVKDSVGNISALSNVVTGLTKLAATVYSDDMESDTNGWTANGLWHEETNLAWSPVTSWAYNSGLPNYNYDTGLTNSGTLTSPMIDLSNVQSVQLSFKSWYQTESSSTAYDQRKVYMGINGTFTQLSQLSADTMLQWNYYKFDLAPEAGRSKVQIKFSFDTVDAFANTYQGFYIDDVRIFGSIGQVPINQPPAASNDNFTLAEDNVLTQAAPGVLANDTDPDSPTLTAQLVDNVSHGTLVLQPNGSFSYTPNPNFNGTDSFSYKASDSNLDSNIAIVSLVILPANDAPTANAGVDQTGVVSQNLNFDGSGSADIDGTIVSYAWDFGDGSKASGPLVLHSFNSTGTYTVTLIVTDNEGATATDTAKVIIGPDTVAIMTSTYSPSRKQLTVAATSTASGSAVLTVVGYGTMTYNSSSKLYQLSTTAPNISSVTVTSSLGGSATKPISKVK